jgi:hypothetical protein
MIDASFKGAVNRPRHFSNQQSEFRIFSPSLNHLQLSASSGPGAARAAIGHLAQCFDGFGRTDRPQ